MRPRIAIPMPHSTDGGYSERAIPQYERAVELAGGEPVRIPLDESIGRVKQIIAGCAGVLLPGSNADVDPRKFKVERSLRSSAPDPQREAIDELLLDDAYASCKPILGICYGLQSLNVFRGGSLIQHIPDFLREELRNRVDHEAGKKVAVAHTVEVEGTSNLARIVNKGDSPTAADEVVIPVNSSHHQAAQTAGAGLHIVGRCPDDSVIEALEGTDPAHFVLAVQWHPERSVDQDEASRAIFRSAVKAAEARTRTP
jgi:putative glutamine amidotransferase